MKVCIFELTCPSVKRNLSYFNLSSWTEWPFCPWVTLFNQKSPLINYKIPRDFPWNKQRNPILPFNETWKLKNTPFFFFSVGLSLQQNPFHWDSSNGSHSSSLSCGRQCGWQCGLLVVLEVVSWVIWVSTWSRVWYFVVGCHGWGYE